MDKSHGMAGGGADGPALSEEIDLVVGVDPSTEVDGEMEIQQVGVRAGAQDRALLFLSLGAGVVRGESGGAADSAVLARHLGVQQFLGGGVGGDFLVGQKCDEAFLERAKAAFDFALGLRTGRDQMGDA
jgi:hypothetical protein